MAVNINTVYQRVLAIANKEQNGYITPQEFNTFANQAQMEIFEQYFYDISQFSRLHGNDTEYSDMLNVLHEKLVPFQRVQKSSIFQTNNPAYLSTFGSNIVTNGEFSDNINNWTAGVTGDVDNGGTQEYDNTGSSAKIKLINNLNGFVFKSSQAITTETNKLYRVKCDIDCSSLNLTGSNPNSTAHVAFGGSISNKISAGFSGSIEFFVTAGSTSTNIKLVVTSTNVNTNDFVLFDNVKVQEVSGKSLRILQDSYSYDGELAGIYRLGSVMYQNASGRNIELSNVLPGEMLQISSAALTKPDANHPVYVRHLDETFKNDPAISVYPSNISGDVTVNYITEPKKCYWGYTIVKEKAMYDATTSTNFELHNSESVTLVNKILELAGISMQKPELNKSSIDRDNKEITQQKMIVNESNKRNR